MKSETESLSSKAILCARFFPIPLREERNSTSSFLIALTKPDTVLPERIVSARLGPTPLTDSQEQAIEDVLAEARTHYRGRGMITDAEWSDYMEELSLGDGR